MDNFIDKLAQKFTAGEVIRTNMVAEERELKRLREQVQEYERCLQEMRKLQMINTEAAVQLKELMNQGREYLKQLEKESLEKLQEAKVSEEERSAGLTEELKKIGEALEESEQGVKQLLERVDSFQKEMEQRFRQSEDYLHKENVKVYRNVQAVVVDEAAKKSEAIIKNQEEQSKKYGKPILILAVLTFLCAAANLVVTYMSGYGI